MVVTYNGTENDGCVVRNSISMCAYMWHLTNAPSMDSVSVLKCSTRNTAPSADASTECTAVAPAHAYSSLEAPKPPPDTEPLAPWKAAEDDEDDEEAKLFWYSTRKTWTAPVLDAAATERIDWSA